MRSSNCRRFRAGLTIRQMMVAIVLIAMALALVVRFGPLVLLIVILFAPALVIGAIVVLNKRRSTQQDALLWVLTIIARKRLPIGPGIEAFAGQWGGRFHAKVRALADLLQMGEPLSDSLDRVSGLLPGSTLVLIRVGEETGLLTEALEAASLQRQTRWPGLGPILSRIGYLLVVLLVIQSISTFILYFITPKLRAIFADFGIGMPSATESIMTLGGTLAEDSVPIFVMAVLLLAMLVSIDVMVSRSGGRSILVDRLFKARHMGTVFRALAVVIEGGKPLQAGVDVLARRHPNGWVRARLTEVERDLAAGEDWIDSFRRQGLLSRSGSSLAASAQRAGNLPWALREMALSGERRLVLRLNVVSQLLFPVAILALGSIVFFLAVSYFYPLIRLIEVLS